MIIYEAHKVLQTSGEVFVPLFWDFSSLMVMNIYSGTIGYVFNDMETLNMTMSNPLKSMESILFKYYMLSLKESLKLLHMVPWVLNHGDVWSYLWLYGYWDVYPTNLP